MRSGTLHEAFELPIKLALQEFPIDLSMAHSIPSIAGLADHDNYHEFCRLLGRFKITYKWASSSVYYLLELWSRLVSSLRYFKGETPSLLNELVLEIMQSFISSKFDSFQVGLSDDLSENPLDNVEILQDQLEC